MEAEALTELGEHIAASKPEAVMGSTVTHDELTMTVRADQLPALVKFLRDDSLCRFSTLVDICGVDYPERSKRFDVVYHFLSMHQNQRLRLKVQTDEETPIPSIAEIFPAANWNEREAYDMYGILFSGHPDLRRILTDYGFTGHPLRKDFPLTGYVEVRYDDTEKRVVYEPVKLTQEFRRFDFMSPWEGAEYILPGDEKASDDKASDKEGA